MHIHKQSRNAVLEWGGKWLWTAARVVVVVASTPATLGDSFSLTTIPPARFWARDERCIEKPIFSVNYIQ